MSRYRAIHCLIWNDDKFPFVSDQCQLMFFHLLTTPMSSPFGLYKASIEALAAEKRWDVKAYRKAFTEGLSNGFMKYDERHLVILIPNFLKYNPPNNPNVLISWKNIYDEIPNCDIKSEFYQSLKDSMKGFGKGFAEAFAKAWPQPLPIQEQEQEQEQIQDLPTEDLQKHAREETTIEPSDSRYKWPKPTKRVPENFPRDPTVAMQAFVNEETPGIDIQRQHRKFLDYQYRDAHSDWHATWRNWMREAYDRMQARSMNGARASPKQSSPATPQVGDLLPDGTRYGA